MRNIDIAFVLDKIRPEAAWRMSDTYENLVATWEDKEQTCPTLEEIVAALGVLNGPPTPEETQKTLTNAVQAHLDKKVNERAYDNIHTTCTYAASTDELFRSEALACIAWRDAVWRACYNILDEVMAGLREIPTVEELLTELPKLIWPEA